MRSSRPLPTGAGGLDLVAASIDVIEASQAPSGAFLASPSFSQYGYSWFRDGSFIAEALDLCGRMERAAGFHGWVATIVEASADGLLRAMTAASQGDPLSAADYLHCRYSVDGLISEVDWPTFQLDGPGIWLWSLLHHRRHGGEPTPAMIEAAGLVARYLAELWDTPCADAWEEHHDRVHTSTLAAIAAGLAAAVELEPGLADAASIVRARAAIRARLAEGEGAWTKWPGNPEVDASLLWMCVPYGLVAPTEPRFAATLRRIETELVSDGSGVHRYASDTFYGGGAWPVLSAARARVLLRRDAPGDVERAWQALRWIEAQSDDRGWLPEQVPGHALAPARIEEWRLLWGESARPLLWSHAAYLSLQADLEARAAAPTALA